MNSTYRPSSAKTYQYEINNNNNSKRIFTNRPHSSFGRSQKAKKYKCHINSISNFPINKKNYNSNYSTLNSSKVCNTEPQNKSASFSFDKKSLYDEVICLKEEVNKLNKELHLEISNSHRKELEYISKNKTIEDINRKMRTSNKIMIDNEDINKLKEVNRVGQYKLVYKQLKENYKNKKNINEDLTKKLKTAKITNMKIVVDRVKKELIKVMNQFQNMNDINKFTNDKIISLTNLYDEFLKNHKIIQMKENYLKEKSVNNNNIRKDISKIREKLSDNDISFKKMNLQSNKIIKEKQATLDSKKGKENSIQKKEDYERKIYELKAKCNNCSKEEKICIDKIKILKKEIVDLEKKSKKDGTSLKVFDYSSLKSIQKNPKIDEDPKIFFYVSLLQDSKNKIEKYSYELLKLENKYNKLINKNYSITNLKISYKSTINDGFYKDENSRTINEEENESSNKNFETISILNNSSHDDKNNSHNLAHISSSAKSSKSNSKNISTISNNNIINNDNVYMSSEEINEYTKILKINFESKNMKSDYVYDSIFLNLSTNIENNEYISHIEKNILSLLNSTNNDTNRKNVHKYISSIFYENNNDQNNTSEYLGGIIYLIKNNLDQDDLYCKKVKKYLISHFSKLKEKIKKIDKNKTGFINYYDLKEILKNEKINLKEKYFDFLLYKMKQFPEKNINFEYLKVENLFNILEDSNNDYLMNEESDKEIKGNENDESLKQGDEYKNINEFLVTLNELLNENKINIKIIFKGYIELMEDELKKRFKVISCYNFFNVLAQYELKVDKKLQNDIYNYFKISDDYKYISLDILEDQLSKIEKNHFDKISESDEYLR